MIKKLLFLVLLISTYSIHAQTTISGVVKDATTNQVLPFVNVFFSGKKIGTKTTENGTFKLTAPTTQDSIFASFLGYKTKGIKIKSANSTGVVILLEDASIVKKEVEIKQKRKKIPKDTLAITIFRNVVANKKLNRAGGYNSYYYNDYTKTEIALHNVSESFGNKKILKPFEYILSNKDTTESDGKFYVPVMLRETVSKNYFQKDPEKTKKIVEADRISAIENLSVGGIIDYGFQDMDIYDNILSISGMTAIMGPFADAGLVGYRYYVEDSSVENGNVVYRLAFAGKSKEDMTFTGKAWIEKGTWAIVDIDMGLGHRANINYVSNFKLRQHFKRVNNRYIVDKETQVIQLNLTKSQKSFDVRVKKTSSRKDWEINNPLSSNVFEGDKVEYKSGYQTNTDSTWKEFRHDSLTRVESNVYERLDSFKNTRAYRNFQFFGRILGMGYVPVFPINWEVGQWYQMFSWNSFEGNRYKFKMRTTREFSRTMRVEPYIAYGTKDNEFKYGITYEQKLPSRNNLWNQFRVNVFKDYFRFGQSSETLNYDNILNSLFRTRPMVDLMKKRNLYFTYEKEWKKGVQTNLWVNHGTLYPVAGRFDFNKTDEQGNVSHLDNLSEFRYGVDFIYAPKQPVYEKQFSQVRVKSFVPIFTTSLYAGHKGFLNSDYSFFTAKLNLKHSAPSALGITKYNVTVAKIFGRVPFTELEIHSGNNTYIRDEYRYHLMNEFEFASDMYGQLWVNHLFEGYFLNKIPGIKKLRLREALTAKVLYGTIDKRNQNYIMDFPSNFGAPNKVYAEAGFAIYNIFKLVRLDFTWRLTDRDLPTTRKFGILGSFQIMM